MKQVPPHTNPILWRERLAIERGGRFSRLMTAFYAIFGGIGGLLFCGLLWSFVDSYSRFWSRWYWEDIGESVIVFVGVSQLLIATFFLPPLVAGGIADERKRETLDLLFATPLTIRQILIGKMRATVPTAARLLGWLGLPLLLALPHRNVGIVQVLLSQLVVFVTAVFVLSFTLYMSSRIRQIGTILSVTYGVLFAWTLITAVMAPILSYALEFGELAMGINFPITLFYSFLDYNPQSPTLLYVMIYAPVAIIFYMAAERRIEKLANR